MLKDTVPAKKELGSENLFWGQNILVLLRIHKFINAIDLHKAPRTTSSKAAAEH